MDITEQVVFQTPQCMTDTPMHYCPGCTHGIIHRLVAEAIDELGIRDRCVGISPVGCGVYIYDYLNCDFIQAAHGRAPAVATGLSRARPETIVFAYQGDGDLAAIGTAEIIHAAARDERMTVIFVNNAIYGMTQGQYAPTTLIGQRTSTSPRGRTARGQGYPLRVSEMLATLEGPTYVARATTVDPRTVRQAKQYILRAFQAQVEHRGFGFVEMLSTCPTHWAMSPTDALAWAKERMVGYYPLGEFADRRGSRDNVSEAESTGVDLVAQDRDR